VTDSLHGLQSRILLLLCIPFSNCAQSKIETANQLSYNRSSRINEVDHKSNKNAVIGVGKLNIPVVNKSVTATVKKIEIEVAASL